MEEMNEELVSSLVTGGKEWLVLTIAAAIPTLWALTLIFHFARPYVVRVLRNLSLRFGADVWWLSYILIRDAFMLMTFAVGSILIMPGIFMRMEIPVFVPLSSLVLFWALVLKLFGDADDDARTFRAISLLLVAAATLFFVSLFFGVEAADQEYLGELPSLLVSSSNLDLAGPILLVSLIGYGLTSLYIFVRFVAALRRPVAGRSEELAARTS